MLDRNKLEEYVEDMFHVWHEYARLQTIAEAEFEAAHRKVVEHTRKTEQAYGQLQVYRQLLRECDLAE